MAGATSSACGLVLFGIVHDATKSYDIALTTGTVAFLVGAASFYALKYARPVGAVS
jgi:cyanate permease